MDTRIGSLNFRGAPLLLGLLVVWVVWVVVVVEVDEVEAMVGFDVSTRGGISFFIIGWESLSLSCIMPLLSILVHL